MLLRKAFDILSEYFENKNITFNNDILREQIYEWWFTGDIDDIFILCGCVIEYGHYDVKYTRKDMYEAGLLFRNTICDNIH